MTAAAYREAHAACAPAAIDLMKAFPPTPAMLDGALRDTLIALSREPGLGARIRLNRPGGNREDREAGAAWLSCRFDSPPAPERLLVTNGTQSALALIFQTLAAPGDLIAAESLTYAVLPPIVHRLGMRLTGVPLDDQGLIPEAFADICRRQRPRALYCSPTVHNPTASMMPEARRAEIAEIARRHAVPIVEDDVLGALYGLSPRPIAAIAPDITWYCMSTSKCFGMGLRLAYVVAPHAAAAASMLSPAQNLSSWFASSLSLMVVGEWIRSGAGRRIAAAIHEEMLARHALAAPWLSRPGYATTPGALHAWLRLPPRLNAETFAENAARAGVLVRQARLFAVDDSPPPNAVRVSLSTPIERADLALGLQRIDSLLPDEAA